MANQDRLVAATYLGDSARRFPGIGIIHPGDTVKVRAFQIDGVTFKRPAAKPTKKGSDA